MPSPISKNVGNSSDAGLSGKGSGFLDQSCEAPTYDLAVRHVTKLRENQLIDSDKFGATLRQLLDLSFDSMAQHSRMLRT